MRIPTKTERKGERAHIPAWLSDREGVAPCYCGRPMQPGEPHIVGTGENGLKRWFHGVCWDMMMDINEDDFDDEEWDWEDDDED